MPIKDCCDDDFHACCTDTTNPIIVLPRESGMTARFLNPERAGHSYFKVDGCLVSNEIAADWVIIKDGVGAVVVELKGKGVMRGVEQIRETVKQIHDFLPERHNGRVAGLLVSVRVPQGARSDLQRAQTRFRRDFRANLKTCNGKKDHSFSDLFG